MTREGHYNYMLRKLREEREGKTAARWDMGESGWEINTPESLTAVDILKKEIYELQKGLNTAYITIKNLKDELTYYEKQEGTQ